MADAPEIGTHRYPLIKEVEGMKLARDILAILLVYLNMGIYEGYFLCIWFFDVEIIEKIFNVPDILTFSVRFAFYLVLDDYIGRK